MQNGVLAGYPLLGVKATLYDGSFHDVDSSEMAFKIAGSAWRFKEGSPRSEAGVAGADDAGRGGDTRRLHG